MTETITIHHFFNDDNFDEIYSKLLARKYNELYFRENNGYDNELFIK